MDGEGFFGWSNGAPGRLNRRRLLCVVALGSAAVLGACAAPPAAPTAPAPTSAPTKPAAAPTAAPKPAEAATAAPKPAATQASAPAPTQAPAKPQPVVNVKFGMISGIFDNAFTMIGKDKGIFRTYGIEPEWVGFQDGVTITKALLAGELLVGELGPAPIFPAVEGGAAMKVIAATKPKLNFFIASRKEISSLTDLYGKNLGHGGVGSQIHTVLMATFEASKIDPDRMNYINIGPTPQVFQALVAGKIDATALTAEFSFLVREDPGLKVLIDDLGALLPRYLRFTLVARDQDLQSQREAFVNTVKAVSESYRYVPTHRSEVVQVAVEQLGNKQEEAQRRYDLYMQQRLFDPNLSFTRDQIQYMQEMNIKIKRQETVLPFERVATFDLVDQVQKDLGKFNWQ